MTSGRRDLAATKPWQLELTPELLCLALQPALDLLGATSTLDAHTRLGQLATVV